MHKSFIYLGAGLLVFTLVGCERKAKEAATMDQSATLVEDVQSGQQTASTMAAAVGGDQAAQAVNPTATAAAMPGTAPSAAEGTMEQVITSATSFEKPTVEKIQEALKNAGLYAGEIDGKLGPRTQKAIEEFQSQNGLAVDGKIGPRTWAKLSSHLYAASQPMTQ